jgi:cardiolipin synthase
MSLSSTIPFVPSASYPVRPGNAVRPLIDGKPAFRRICEVIEAAEKSVWATVTFLWESFEMPDDRGSVWDVLDRAATRGIDVRLIFWRPDGETAYLRRNAFWGSKEHIEWLDKRVPEVNIRWDRAHQGFCQHQKSWIIDAGAENEISFVGEINLNPHSMVTPGHDGEGQNHDVYVELAGPSVVDVHHNFVQRWNEASERTLKNGRWGIRSNIDLPFPNCIPANRGDVTVQVQRTIHPGRYTDGQAIPAGMAFDIASGEYSIFDQHMAAFRTARRSIYLEQHSVGVPQILNALQQALERGVEVVLLMPAENPDILPILTKLGTFDHFMLAGIAGKGADGLRKPVYVHAKLMLIDDE